MSQHIMVLSFLWMTSLAFAQDPGKKEIRFGKELSTEYSWLEDLKDPKVVDWANSQSKKTEEVFKERQKFWTGELEKLGSFDRYWMPTIKVNGLRYFFKTDAKSGRNHLYVEDSKGNENLLVDGSDIVLEDYVVTESRKYLAYRFSQSGGDWLQTRVKDLKTGKDLSDNLVGMKWYGPVWNADDSGFFYVRYPDIYVDKMVAAKNPQLYFHKLGTHQKNDTLLFDPKNDETQIDASLTRDGRYFIVNEYPGSDGKGKSYIWKLSENYLSSPQPLDLTQSFVLGNNFEEKYWFRGSKKDMLYFLTSRGAPNLKIISVKIPSKPGVIDRSLIKTVIKEDKFGIDDAVMGKKGFIVSKLVDAKSELFFYGLDRALIKQIPLPEMGGISSISASELSDDILIMFQSYNRPRTIYEIDPKDFSLRLWKSSVPNNFQANVITRQKFVKTRDGARVPYFVSYSKSTIPTKAPVLVIGYGCYGSSQIPAFGESYYTWMQNGGVIVVPGVRGGGEYGEKWHQAGSRKNKINSYQDFAEVLKDLKKAIGTQSKSTVIMGSSCGGALSAYTALNFPDLMSGAIIWAGIIDLLNFPKFGNEALWISELGDPFDKTEFEMLYKLSPLQNINAKKTYPGFLIITGDQDTRVSPSHSFKFAARLLNVSKGRYPVYFHLIKGVGHAGPNNLEQVMEWRARYLAFADLMTKAKK